MFQVRVPATSANLGPGFDCMGLALKLYNTFTVEQSDRTEIILKGTYTKNISTGENNLLWRTACKLWKRLGLEPQPLRIVFENHVPPSRGLGSSSTAIAGGLIIANHLSGSPFNTFQLLEIATSIEGHPDNVAPAFYGGVNLTVMTEHSIVSRTLSREPKLRVVVVIPNILVETDKARRILPAEIPRQDTIFNASRVGLLVDAFIRNDFRFLDVATQDRIHQTQRAPLIPGMPEALQKARDAGAYGAALSGSGPTLIAFCPVGKEGAVSKAMIRALKGNNLEARGLALDIDPQGAIIFT